MAYLGKRLKTVVRCTFLYYHHWFVSRIVDYAGFHTVDYPNCCTYDLLFVKMSADLQNPLTNRGEGMVNVQRKVPKSVSSCLQNGNPLTIKPN